MLPEKGWNMNKSKELRKEYGVCFTSNNGTEIHIGGHYIMRESAEASAKKHRSYGNRNVFIVERDVTEWRRSER